MRKWKAEQRTDQHGIRPFMPGHSHKRRAHDRPRNGFSYLMKHAFFLALVQEGGHFFAAESAKKFSVLRPFGGCYVIRCKSSTGKGLCVTSDHRVAGSSPAGGKSSTRADLRAKSTSKKSKPKRAVIRLLSGFEVLLSLSSSKCAHNGVHLRSWLTCLRAGNAHPWPTLLPVSRPRKGEADPSLPRGRISGCSFFAHFLRSDLQEFQ
jgi:hypothetical protein